MTVMSSRDWHVSRDDHVEEGERDGLSQCLSPYVLFVNHINNNTSQNVSAVGFTV